MRSPLSRKSGAGGPMRRRWPSGPGTLSAVAAVLLIGCAGEPEASPPSYLNDGLFPLAAARTIATRCADLGLKAVLERQAISDLVARLAAEGYSEQDARRFVAEVPREPALRQRIEQYFATRGVNASSPPEALCRLGVRERDAASSVGFFLGAA